MFRTFVSVLNISAFAKSLSAQSVPYQSRKILFRSFPRLGLYVRSKKSLKVSSTMFSFLLVVRACSYVSGDSHCVIPYSFWSLRIRASKEPERLAPSHSPPCTTSFSRAPLRFPPPPHPPPSPWGAPPSPPPAGPPRGGAGASGFGLVPSPPVGPAVSWGSP